MNPEQQGQRASAGNQVIQDQVDKMILTQLKLMRQNEEVIKPAMLNALTARYGKPQISEEGLSELERELRLIGGEGDFDDAEVSA